MNNKPHTKRARERISKARKGQFSGEKHWNWKGGRMIIGGYRYVHKPSHPNATKMGYVCEHRLVVERHLGRYLKKSETIHHMNHDRLDNRLENLMICKSNGRHTAEHHTKRDASGKFASQ